MGVKLIGNKFIYGSVEPRPICNLPPGARYRLRIRGAAFAKCFVKTKDGITQHCLEEMPGTKGEWLLSYPIAQNKRA